MPFDANLLSFDDPVAFRRWCRFQLYDMPASTQETVVCALRTLIRRPHIGPVILAAMAVDLPGVGLGYQESWAMQTPLSTAPHLLMFRFYTGRPAELAPARLFQTGHDHQEMIRILRGERKAQQRVQQGLPEFLPRTQHHDRLGHPTPPGRLPTSASRTTPSMLRQDLAVTPADLQNQVGANERDQIVFQTIAGMPTLNPQQKADLWMSYKHQTGRRDMSPFLSCTAVMPRMVRSGSKVLREDVMPLAPCLGIFLVPTTNFVVQWIHVKATELTSVVHSVEEVEVLYRPLPPMESFQLIRFQNPFCRANGGAPIPGAQSGGDAGTTTLGNTADPGFAPNQLPGLIYDNGVNLLALP
jgi:hypothetical protein